jgi:hypothetical protein
MLLRTEATVTDVMIKKNIFAKFFGFFCLHKQLLFCKNLIITLFFLEKRNLFWQKICKNSQNNWDHNIDPSDVYKEVVHINALAACCSGIFSACHRGDWSYES